MIARATKLMQDPFIAGTPPAEQLAATLESTAKPWMDADDDGEVQINDELEKIIAQAEKTLKKAGTFGAETQYTKFLNWAMHPDPSKRPSAAEALQHPFLADRLLDDDAARDVLKMVLGDKPPEQAAEPQAEEAGGAPGAGPQEEAAIPPPPADEPKDEVVYVENSQPVMYKTMEEVESAQAEAEQAKQAAPGGDTDRGAWQPAKGGQTAPATGPRAGKHRAETEEQTFQRAEPSEGATRGQGPRIGRGRGNPKT